MTYASDIIRAAAGKDNGANQWGTRDELQFIDHTICKPAGLAEQEMALENYLANAARRFSWGEVDAVAVVIYANKRLREIKQLLERYGD